MPKPPQERYLAKPFQGSSHSWAQSQLAAISQKAHVLDVGAGQGALGTFLRGLGVTQLTALELDPQAHALLSQHYQRVLATPSELGQEERFDVILLLDVLEHISQPEAFFQQLLQYAAPGALLLISVPNIAHWSVRIPLLFGHFEYHSRGILDGTHLQFLSRKRLRRMLSSSSCRLLGFDSTIEPLEFLVPRWLHESTPFHLLRLLHLNLARILPGFFSYQHVCAARLQETKEPQ